MGSDDVVLGFHLAGVEGAVVHDEASARETFQRVLAMKGLGIVLMEDTIADLIREEVDAYIFSHQFPLICEIPGTQGRDPNRQSLHDLAVQAMGIKI
ncbi:V-type ATP synthase subunit F [Entomospira culicis]|nr:V-type ATP synthase subunit F [Entomospira culicis]WDI37979.1 V-type ATP synthase subunit F [Entomospira culicis]